MHLLLERERETTVKRDEIAGRKRYIEAQIERLRQPGGTEDSRLTSLAERSGACCFQRFMMTLRWTTRYIFGALWLFHPGDCGTVSVAYTNILMV